MKASNSSMTGRLSGQFIDEWQYTLILLGGWAGFVDELLTQLYPVPLIR